MRPRGSSCVISVTDDVIPAMLARDVAKWWGPLPLFRHPLSEALGNERPMTKAERGNARRRLGVQWQPQAFSATGVRYAGTRNAGVGRHLRASATVPRASPRSESHGYGRRRSHAGREPRPGRSCRSWPRIEMHFPPVRCVDGIGQAAGERGPVLGQVGRISECWSDFRHRWIRFPQPADLGRPGDHVVVQQTVAVGVGALRISLQWLTSNGRSHSSTICRASRSGAVG